MATKFRSSIVEHRQLSCIKNRLQFGHNEHLLTTSSSLYIILPVVSESQCTTLAKEKFTSNGPQNNASALSVTDHHCSICPEREARPVAAHVRHVFSGFSTFFSISAIFPYFLLKF